MTRQTLTSIFFLVLLLGQSTNVGAAGTADVGLGTYYLQAGMPDQTIAIYVSGGAQASGMNFNLQIGDGGTAAGGTPGPVFTGLDLVHNTIFENDYEAPHDLGSIPQLLTWDIVTAHDGDTVPADGLLATVTVDTTGFLRGQTFPLLIDSTRNGPTTFLDVDGHSIPSTLTDGEIVLIPEPSTLAILAACGVVLCYRAGRRTLPRRATV